MEKHPHPCRPLRTVTAALTTVLALPLISVAQPTNYQERPAIFKVTTDVVNPDLPAFTVTGPAFGNTINRTGKGAFEPATFRTRLTAQQDSPNRIYDDSGAGIYYFDLYQSGYLDGADVQVYRIVNGEVKLVREDVVAPGGTVIENWNYGNERKVIPADASSAQFKWADWSRPGSERWFAVFAVDTSGNVSEPSNTLRFDQRVATKGAKPAKNEENFRAKRGGDSEAPPAPTGFKGGYNNDGILEFSWNPVQADDLAGYYLARSDTPPDVKRGIFLELAGEASTPEAEIQSGDMVIVSRTLAEFTPEWMSNRVANLSREYRKFIPDNVPNDVLAQPTDERTWRLAKHDGNTPVENPGEYYFEITVEPGETQLIGKHGIPDISNTQQEYYPVPKDGAEYIMEVWMKADQPGRAPVVFTWDGDDRIGGFVGEHPIQVSDQWEKHTVRFTGKSSDDGHHAYFVLKTQGPGTYAFDNYRVYNSEADYLDYLPYQYENLKQSGMSSYRTHGPIKTGTATYSMRQYLGEAGQAEGVARGNTLAQALKMMKKAEVDPWLQIEYHMTPDEWLAFMEYMAAPFDPSKDSKTNKPYAALRYAQGQAAPWMDEFDTIYFELSNETWNGMFRPWVFSNMTDAATGENIPRGSVYAKFHDYVVGVLESSPYWKPEFDETFVQVLGGWATTLNRDTLTQGYTQEIATTTKTGEFITIAAYNGGWDEGEGPPQENPASYFNVLSQVNQTAIPRVIRLNEVTQVATDRLGREVKFGTYEAGPGYAMNGLNNARVTQEQRESQENVMKSKLAGVATLDSFLARAKYGSDIDNFFTFAEGDYWKSHAKKHRGGQPHASFLPLITFNQVGTGDMLFVETLSVPTADTKEARRRAAVENQPLAAAYATREGQRVTLFCINRQFPNYPIQGNDGVLPFGVELPFNQAESITLYRMTGAPTEHNIWEENVAIEPVAIDPAQLRSNGQFVVNPETGSTAAGMPPAEVYTYVFEGTNIGAEGVTFSQDQVRAQATTFSGE